MLDDRDPFFHAGRGKIAQFHSLFYPGDQLDPLPDPQPDVNRKHG
jgi:hypothetical protein